MPEYKKGQVWNKAKNKLMLKFESETSKNAIYNNKITGQFEYWLWQQQKILQKQLEAHWKATEKERKKTHTGKLYEKQIKTYKIDYIKKLKIKEAREKQQEALTFLRKSEIKIKQYLKEPDIPAAKTRLTLAKRRLPYLIDKDNIQKWTKTVELLEKEINERLIYIEKSDLMIKFEKETGKKAIYNEKITKQFSSWLSEEEHFEYQLSKQRKKVTKRRTKEENYQIRLKMIETLYWNIFVDTEGLALYTKTDMKEAYRQAKWLENKRLIVGQASSGTGISTPRGTYRIKQILWEPKYTEERDGNWEEYIIELKKAMNIT